MVNASGEEDAGKRLDILNKSNDGFYIASEDLKLRGPGAWKCTERLSFKLEGKKYHRTSYVSADTGAASVPRGMDCVSGR